MTQVECWMTFCKHQGRGYACTKDKIWITATKGDVPPKCSSYEYYMKEIIVDGKE